MNIECFNNHNKPYLRLVASLGLKKVGGRYVHRRKTVLNLGPLDRLDDGRPDFLRRLRESFRAGTPIVESLVPFVGEGGRKKVTITFEEGDASTASARRTGGSPSSRRASSSTTRASRSPSRSSRATRLTRRR